MVILFLDKARNVHNIMILSTKLLHLLGILALGSFSLEVTVAIDDLDETLKKALFLVKLLKSDFAQILRSNDGVTENSTEDENSTCSLPSEEFNSTITMNDTAVTDSPAKSRGKFRRLDNDPNDDRFNTPATSQAQSSSSLPSATSEAKTLHVETTTLAQPSTSILPTTEQPNLRTTISPYHTILQTANSAKQTIAADPSKETILSTIAKSILLTATSTKQFILQTAEEPNEQTPILSTLTTKHRKSAAHRTRVPVSKAKTTLISNRNAKRVNVSRHHIRHHTLHTTTTEKWTKEDGEISEVATELEKELKSTNTEHVNILHDSYKDHKLKNNTKTTTTTRTTTTMKVFLQGSSRIPIPFPQNNGFCHFHPENALCGAN